MKKKLEPSVTSPEHWIIHQLKVKSISHSLLTRNLIIGFFPSLYQYIRQNFEVNILDRIHKHNPIYSFKYRNTDFAFVFPGFGASVSTIILEECITLGSEKILFFGTAGSLLTAPPCHNLFVINAAISDEGTSRHYFFKSHHCFKTDTQFTNQIESVVKNNSLDYVTGKTWTTDALYRETAARLKKRKKQGCICVDMEASALIAVSNYHNKAIGGFFIPHDQISARGWKINSGVPTQKPSRLFQLALDVFCTP